jgi:hypothetical protein
LREQEQVQELEQEQQKERPKFYIDTRWYDEHNRSFLTLAQGRFCSSCQDKTGSEVQERVPTYNEKTGRVVYETRSVPYGANPFSVVRSCCSKAKGYITTETPILEAIFRVFLANSNQPADADSIREQLGEWIPLTGKPHSYDADFIERIIKADHYYGLREFRITE